MTFVKPKDHDGIAVDDIIPKTAASPIDIKPSSGGGAYASFDGANIRFRTNKLEPLSGSEIALNSARLTGLGTPTSGTHATTKTYVDGTILTYTPVVSASGGMGITLSSTTRANYRVENGGSNLWLDLYITVLTSGTPGLRISVTIPNAAGSFQILSSGGFSGTLGNSPLFCFSEGGSSIGIERGGAGNFPIESMILTVTGILAIT